MILISYLIFEVKLDRQVLFSNHDMFGEYKGKQNI